MFILVCLTWSNVFFLITFLKYFQGKKRIAAMNYNCLIAFDHDFSQIRWVNNRLHMGLFKLRDMIHSLFFFLPTFVFKILFHVCFWSVFEKDYSKYHLFGLHNYVNINCMLLCKVRVKNITKNTLYHVMHLSAIMLGLHDPIWLSLLWLPYLSIG